MIDTIKLLVHVPEPDMLLGRLSDVRETLDYKQDYTIFRGRVRSMRATLRFDSLILEGSLPGYQEATTLNAEETRDALGRLEEELGVPIADADVWRVDVFADLKLSRAVSAYLPLFVQAPRYKRVAIGGSGLRYELKVRHLVFYDKVAERRDKGHTVPVAYEGHQVLRYEMQLRRRVRRQLGLKVFRAADLTQPGFRHQLVSRWVAEYHKIVKQRVSSGLRSTDDIRGLLASIGVDQVGLAAIEQQLFADYQAGVLSKSKYYRDRKWVREINEASAFSQPSELVEELDGEVNRAAVCMIEK